MLSTARSTVSRQLSGIFRVEVHCKLLIFLASPTEFETYVTAVYPAKLSKRYHKR